LIRTTEALIRLLEIPLHWSRLDEDWDTFLKAGMGRWGVTMGVWEGESHLLYLEMSRSAGYITLRVKKQRLASFGPSLAN